MKYRENLRFFRQRIQSRRFLVYWGEQREQSNRKLCLGLALEGRSYRPNSKGEKVTSTDIILLKTKKQIRSHLWEKHRKKILQCKNWYNREKKRGRIYMAINKFWIFSKLPGLQEEFHFRSHVARCHLSCFTSVTTGTSYRTNLYCSKTAGQRCQWRCLISL